MISEPTVDVVILNLNEFNVVKDSITRLLKEPWNIILVDNGSDEDEKGAIRDFVKDKAITLVDLPENRGASVGRNAGLDLSSSEYVFLLDGDILYIPRTISYLIKAIPDDAACLGVHHETRWDGTKRREEADLRCPVYPGLPRDTFPMAWTQYGLFRGDFLRKVRFVTEGAFGEAGNGYEDDFLYHDILKAGLKSYFLPNVLYYHEAHGGQRWLDEKEMANRNEERRKIFEKHWKTTPWYV